MLGIGHSWFCSACRLSLPWPVVLLNLAAAALVSCDLMSVVAPLGVTRLSRCSAPAALISEFSVDSAHRSVSLPPPSGLCSPHTSVLVLAGTLCCCLGFCVLHSVSSCRRKLFLRGDTAASPCLDFLSSALAHKAGLKPTSVLCITLPVCCDGPTVLSQPVSLSPWQDLYPASSLSSACPS